MFVSFCLGRMVDESRNSGAASFALTVASWSTETPYSSIEQGPDSCSPSLRSSSANDAAVKLRVDIHDNCCCSAFPTV